MKVVTIVGARPQFVKCAAVSRQLVGTANEIIIHTGQHYDAAMSDVFFEELEIPRPHYNLGIGSGLHGQQTGAMLEAIERILVEQTPDWVLVYGDTNSTLAGALAASKLHIPIAHIEAGLRSFNRRMPEEVNRVITDHVSLLNMCPTTTAVANLANEGIRKGAHLVGDVMYDSAIRFRELANEKSDLLRRLGIADRDFVLATIHRAENTNSSCNLAAIIGAFTQVGERLPVVMPTHPRTRHALEAAGLWQLVCERLIPIDPVGYLDMVMLESHAKVIATDSGGIQKEAFFFKVPCVTLRDETEWVELVQCGWNTLVSPATGSGEIARVIINTSKALSPTNHPTEIYGTGNASATIVDLLKAHGTSYKGEQYVACTSTALQSNRYLCA